MNLPRYKFSKETEPELLQFLKIANEQKSKNKNCDLKKFEVWSKLLPVDSALVQKLNENVESNALKTIDLCSDEEMQIPQSPVNQNMEETEAEIDSKSAISDMAYVIKENLQTQNNLADVAKEHLSKCQTRECEMLFEILKHTLSTEEVYCLGNELQTIISDVSLAPFCDYLLIPKIQDEYCDKIFKLLDYLSIKYPSVLEKKCFLVLQELTFEEGTVFLQYIKKLNSHFQSTLVGNYILALRSLDENNLLIIGVLLNDQVEYEALNRLVEMLSNMAEEHSKDKNFGKLLVNVIDILGPNLIRLEQPLKHIIAGHKSVWKSKLEKTFSTCYSDSLMFTQSFRD